MLKETRLFLFTNTGLRQTVVKNAFWLFSGQIMGRAIRAIIVIYAARVLGTAGFGVASYALSITAFFSILADMGVSTILTKKVAQNPSEQKRYFSTTLIIKCVCVVTSFLAIIILGPRITNIHEAEALLPLAALVLIFDSMREFMLALVRAREKMEYEAALNVATNIGTVALSAGLLFMNPIPQSLILGYAFGSGFGLVLALIALRNYIAHTYVHFDRQLVVPILTQAFPLALTALLGGTMLTIDTLMLGFWRTAGEIGLYAAAQKPVQLVYGFAALVGTSIFPAFSRLGAGERKKFRSALNQTLTASIIVSGILTVICVLFAKKIMVIAYGTDYGQAGTAFALLALTFVINTPIVIGFNALLAVNKQNIFLWSSPIAALSNAGLNALLIPRWGIEGAALSTLITQIAINAYLWKKIREI